MSTRRRAVVLVGSPRASKSTSESLGAHLLSRLQDRGLETEKLHIHASLKSQQGRDGLLSAVGRADLIILACPLYVDNLPAPVISTLELIMQHRDAGQARNRQSLLAIVNCGFPEAHHNHSALAICRRFAAEAGFDWAGGLALGMGEAIEGRPLEVAGGLVRNVKKSLDLAAAALAEGEPVPEPAVELMAKRLVPKWMYLWFGTRRWKRRAKKWGVKDQMESRPYQQKRGG